MQTRRGFFAAIAGLFGAFAGAKIIPEPIVETLTPLAFRNVYTGAFLEIDRMSLLCSFANIRHDYICSLAAEDERLTKAQRCFDPARLPI